MTKYKLVCFDVDGTLIDNVKVKDIRKVLSYYYYYCPSSEGYGKATKSCKLAGYTEQTANRASSDILDLGRFTETMDREWKTLSTNLININIILKNYLKT